jgi:methyltransferase OMS1
MGMSSFTGLDISPGMLDVASEKLIDLIPSLAASKPTSAVVWGGLGEDPAGVVEYTGYPVRLVKSSALTSIPPPPSSPGTTNAKYDTIIQTFGLCSVSDPGRVLSKMAEVVKPGSGRVILLEHGRSSYSLVNSLLDKHATNHFMKYGCWWNRDIEGIIRQAVSNIPELQIVRLERPSLQLGTVLVVELKVMDT